MNGLVQQAIEQQLLTVAQRVEDQLDDQLHAIDKLDADDIEALRERRLQINAEKSPFLTEHLKVWTLALIRAGKAVDYVVGFQDPMGGADDFPTSALEARLLAAGLLHETEAPKAALQQRTVRKGGNANGLGQQRMASDEDSDFSE